MNDDCALVRRIYEWMGHKADSFQIVTCMRVYFISISHFTSISPRGNGGAAVLKVDVTIWQHAYRKQRDSYESQLAVKLQRFDLS